MKKISFLCLLTALFFTIAAFPQHKTDANIIGHVLSEGEHIGFVNIAIQGTAIGTVTDPTGHFRMVNLPAGSHTLIATCIGYKPVEKQITVTMGSTIEVNFEMEQDLLGLEEVVVSSDRNAKKRGSAPTVVNTLSHKKLGMIQSVTLSDGLNFLTGLRMESNCQNCGLTQVRMNGLEGSYTQILVNSRAVFSGLAAIYGLELIPSNIIERIEVVRGGGSALYGGNAIAGTVNLILKDPIKNYYEVGGSSGLTVAGTEAANPTMDHSINFNASVVSDDYKTGLTVYGFYRDRDAFDANNDGFSELVEIDNTSLGTRFYHRFGYRSKLSAEFLNIREQRRGGDHLDRLPHEADIAEAVDHNIINASLNFDQFFRKKDKLSLYAAGQMVDRDSYYGAARSLTDYGHSRGFTHNAGIQYSGAFDRMTLVTGIENTGDLMFDEKLGFPDIDNAVINEGVIVSIPHAPNTTIVHQSKNATGLYTQLEIEYDRLNFSAGARYEYYVVNNLRPDENQSDAKVKGNVISPRLSAFYSISEHIKLRVSYAQGYRAPQVFDEDLHIEASGSRKVVHRNDPDLKQESSHSLTGSADMVGRVGNTTISLLAEGFYTRLLDPFTNVFGSTDENGVLIYTRTNAEEGATVAGMNFEADLVPGKSLAIKAGYTLQMNRYDKPQEFNETRFFRTPQAYGYVMGDIKPLKKFGISFTGNYTGRMLVPHFGLDPETADPSEMLALNKGEVIEGERLEVSHPFYDLGVKLRYTIRLNGAKLQLLGGVKNLFNAFQSDFDRGFYRDPGYVYGPNQPRMVYIGFKLGNRVE
jgi:outer membrane receptor for ferrienterochelin and colicins